MADQPDAKKGGGSNVGRHLLASARHNANHETEQELRTSTNGATCRCGFPVFGSPHSVCPSCGLDWSRCPWCEKWNYNEYLLDSVRCGNCRKLFGRITGRKMHPYYEPTLLGSLGAIFLGCNGKRGLNGYYEKYGDLDASSQPPWRGSS